MKVILKIERINAKGKHVFEEKIFNSIKELKEKREEVEKATLRFVSSEVVKPVKSNKPKYQQMIDECIEKNWLIRPIWQSGSGRYARYSDDHTKEYCEYIKSLGYTYELGNDAPKGGKLGDYIKVIVKEA